MIALRRAVRLTDDDQAITRLLRRLAEVLDVDPAIFAKDPREEPRAGAGRPLDAGTEAALARMPDREVRDRLRVLLRALRPVDRAH